MDKKAVDKWTDDQLQALVSLYVEEDIRQLLETVVQNGKSLW